MRPLEFAAAEEAWVARNGSAYQQRAWGIGIPTPDLAAVPERTRRAPREDGTLVRGGGSCIDCGKSIDRRAERCWRCSGIARRRHQ